MDKIYNRIAEYSCRNNLFQQGESILVGVSGGADSIFLLHALCQLKERFSLQIAAVHIHHGIRGGEADRDQEFTQKFAERLGIACYLFHEDVPCRAKEWEMSVEEAGRAVRYQCFEKLRQRLGFDWIAVAHNRNDQAETILLQLLRGSGLRGLGGIRAKRDRVIRPLLFLERAEIEAALQKEGLGYCEDATNSGDAYARNRIRNHVLPYLQEQLQPAAVDHIARAGEQLQGIMDYIGQQSRAVAKRNVKKGMHSCKIECAVLLEQAPVIQGEILLQMMEELVRKRKDITSRHIAALQKLAAGETGKKIMLPYHLMAEKTYTTLEIFLTGEGKRQGQSPTWEQGVAVRPGDSFCIPAADTGQKWTVWFERCGRGEILPEELKNHCTKCFDYAKMDSMPVFRYPAPGDYLWLDRDGRKKKLSRIFIDDKLPLSRRERLIVLAQGPHVLWIPELNRSSVYFYVTSQTDEILCARIHTHKA
ncbi:MAG: tRNA lysidine(34) synthetase TilS [Clostridiaceae bacterium]|nr:tRNA lysidine(34) synthetase TilS [Clostridiaceae bacterium]